MSTALVDHIGRPQSGEGKGMINHSQRCLWGICGSPEQGVDRAGARTKECRRNCDAFPGQYGLRSLDECWCSSLNDCER